jgi:membrane protein YqaA with SNARE-associated domain
MFRKLYEWTISLAGRPRAPVALGAVSFAESSFFPIPPDVVLVPMALARPDRAWLYAAICTVTSVLGGLVGYMIGWLLYDTVGAWVIRLYGLEGKAEAFRAQYAAIGHWVILIKGFTPIPFKLVTIMSGAASYDLFWFVLLSTLTRGGRFFAVAGLMNRFAGPVKAVLEKHTDLVVIVIVAAIVAGFLIARWLI